MINTQLRSLFNANDPQINYIISTYEKILSVYEVLQPLYRFRTHQEINYSDTTNNTYRFDFNNSTQLYRIAD